jgi:protein phosphatase
VPGKIAWLDLSKVYEKSDLNLDELTPSAQDDVKQGIEFDSADDARRSLATLTDPNSSARKSRCSSSPVGSTNGSPSPGTSSSPPGLTSTSPIAPGSSNPSLTPTGPDSAPMSASPTPTANC